MTINAEPSPELKALLERVDAAMRQVGGLVLELQQSRTHRMRMLEVGKELTPRPFHRRHSRWDADGR